MISETAEQPRKRLRALASLGLGDEEWVALAGQGAVIADRSGPGKGRHKLRFRLEGRQRVRYLGGAGEFVEQVRQELAVLQQPTQARRHRCRLLRGARACLRETKQQAEPVFAQYGYRFRGREIRRVRRRQSGEQNRDRRTLDTQWRTTSMEGFSNERRGSGDGIDGNKNTAGRGGGDQFQEELNELRQSAREKTEPMQKVARCAAADLLEVASLIGDAIKDEFKARRPDFREARDTMPTIKGWSSLHRQAYRFAKLDHEYSKAKMGDGSDAQPVLPEQAEKRGSDT